MYAFLSMKELIFYISVLLALWKLDSWTVSTYQNDYSVFLPRYAHQGKYIAVQRTALKSCFYSHMVVMLIYLSFLQIFLSIN